MKTRHAAAHAAPIIAASLVCATQSLNAAVQIANNVVVSSTVDTSVSAALPHGAGSDKYRITGAVTALTGSTPSPGALSYTGASSLNAAGAGSGGNSQTFNNIITHTVGFSLAANEVVDISFTGNYAVGSPVITGQVSWTLTGPGATNVWTPQSFTGTTSGSINESVLGLTSVAGGNYTLTLTTRTSGDTTSKVADLASSSFSNLNFAVTPVPEPGSLGLIMGAAAGLMLVRRRA